MKLLLTVVALAAFAHAAPTTTTTHTMEVGANGVTGSILNVPLVEIAINIIKDVAGTVVPGTANEEAQSPVIVVDQAQNPEPVTVVDQAVNPAPVNVIDQIPVVVVDMPEQPFNPIDVMPVNPIAPEVLPAPSPVEVIDVLPAPIVLPEPTPAEVVPAPIVPQPVDVVDIVSPIVVPEPVVLPEPTPAEVVAPQPVQVIELAPETPVADGASPSQIINVMLNFIFGESGSLTSVEVPANVIPQLSAMNPRV